ncbi:zinc ribbon domain-containing protein [Nonomuraea diastatica]|uniref:Uncharacterized protein n=1 Tax=Nonomuraea diastatica TaxID=1848329 RepID=A0A4R4VZT6_9ACTN|nr:hypothetical protein E1294_49115 [Nonomuraea diastatica]
MHPAYTSQTCPEPACGKMDEKSRKSQAVFSCTSCGASSTPTSWGRGTSKPEDRRPGWSSQGVETHPGPRNVKHPVPQRRAAQAARAAA